MGGVKQKGLYVTRGDGFALSDCVIDEVRRAQVKFPTWPKDLLHALAVVAEELGEAQRAALQYLYEPHKGTSLAEVKGEVVQTAAMCFRLLAALEAGFYEVEEVPGEADLPGRDETYRT